MEPTTKTEVDAAHEMAARTLSAARGELLGFNPPPDVGALMAIASQLNAIREELRSGRQGQQS